jgi:hypothetical protein
MSPAKVLELKQRGVKLAVFMVTVPSESLPRKDITANVSCERLRKFSECIPGRIPDALLTYV